jgi:hypothetical protein
MLRLLRFIGKVGVSLFRTYAKIDAPALAARSPSHAMVTMAAITKGMYEFLCLLTQNHRGL